MRKLLPNARVALLKRLNNESRSTATTVADTGYTNLALLFSENSKQSCDNTSSTGTERVAECNSTAVKVDLVLAQAQDLHVGKCDNAESLVDLICVNVILVHASVLQGLWHGKCGCSGELGRVVCGITPAEDLGDGLQVELLQLGFRDKNDGSTAIRQRRSVGGSDGTILGLECGLKRAGLGLVELCG